MLGTVGVGSTLQTTGAPVGQELAWVKPNSLRDYPMPPAGLALVATERGQQVWCFRYLTPFSPAATFRGRFGSKD